MENNKEIKNYKEERFEFTVFVNDNISFVREISESTISLKTV